MKRSWVIVLILLAIASGCAGVATRSDIETLDRGPYPKDYEAAIKAYYRDFLLDPYSARYEFSKPMAVSYREEPLEGGRLLGGYLVIVRVNAKNRQGEYTGEKTEGFLIKSGRIIKRFDEHDLQSPGF